MTVQQPESRVRDRKLDLPTGVAEVWLERAGTRITLHTVRPNGGGSSNWTSCDVVGCLGETVIQDSKCLLHSDEVNRNQYLNARLGNIRILSLRGVAVTQELITTILRSSLVAERKVTVAISFAGADLCARLDFEGYTFEHWLDFNGAIIHEPVSFRRCFFKDLNASFTFFNAGPPSFLDCEFSGTVDLSYAHAERVSIAFENCSFARSFTADGIDGPLTLKNCRCESSLAIRGANATHIGLDGCSVKGELDIANTSCAGFFAKDLRAASANQVGPLDVKHDCSFARSQFGARVRMEIKANRLDLSGAQLLQGGHILVERARVHLNQLSTGRRLRISGVAKSTEEPAILALQDADAGSMSFAHVDMTRCVFYGSHDLGSIVIEPTVTFAKTPRGWWLTERSCIGDEFAWRRHAGGFTRWSLPGTRIASDDRNPRESRDVVELPALRASQVATVYRELRRSFEAKADQPGAADFYYGEMEMRRHSLEAGIVERVIVWLYWIFSGYGLRASRAFLALSVLIASSACAMANAGFAEGTTCYTDGLIFSLQAVVPGLHYPSKLTTIGRLVEIGLHLLGPLFFALALLAVRGRVKR